MVKIFLEEIKMERMTYSSGMKSFQPAIRWQDALPCGNGTTGALVYGNIKNELVVFNHKLLWLKSEKPVMKPVAQHLEEFRRLLLEGKYKEAEDFFVQKASANHSLGRYHTDPYQPAFDLKIDMGIKTAFKEYTRYIDFETGEAIVRWRDAGVGFRRKLFVSRQDDVVCMSIDSDSEADINCKIKLCPHDIEVLDGMGSGKEKQAKVISFVYNVYSDTKWITFKGCYKDGSEFGGVARVIPQGGAILQSNGEISLSNASKVLIIIKIFAGNKHEGILESQRKEIEELPADYDALLERHLSEHRELFNRLTLTLEENIPKKEYTNELLLMESYSDHVSSQLIKRMFDYGRYLLISSSRQGGLPANLQGIWNGDYDPAWSSDYHNDVNIQMNYWQALPGNLPETVLPYFDYYESMIDDFRANAKNVYNCRGILTPIAQSTNGIVTPDIWLTWTAGAGWLAQLFYDYWLFTRDDEFLKNRTVPFLKEIALFYEDFLFEGNDGKAVFAPSLSPENLPLIKNSSIVTINATMDVAIAKEVLSNLCDSCEYLGIGQANIEKWKDMIRKLPDYEVNEDGAIREWLYPGLKDNYEHRHFSHIYPLFPGLEITCEKNPRLLNAVKVAIEKRLAIGIQAQTGWSFVYMASIYSRLGEGNKALECIEMLCRSCVGPNLFTYHNDWRSQGLTMFWGYGNPPPFQIEANMGFTSVILEMLAFSAPGIIKILPALPDKWEKGEIKGMLCRGAIILDLQWDFSQNEINIALCSKVRQKLILKFPTVPKEIKFEPSDIYIDNSILGSEYREIELLKNTRANISITLSKLKS